jgi:uncharacterized protein
VSSSIRVVRASSADGIGLAKPLKIVVTGPFSTGKTTLIETVSETDIVSTEKYVTDDTRNIKTQTTVAMDFGRITFRDGASLFLFGTPGQQRFEVMWEVLAHGMIGFIVLVDGSDERSSRDADRILQKFLAYADVPCVVGVTHLDVADRPRELVLETIRSDMSLPPGTKVVPCDVRKKEDVKELILHTLLGVLDRLETAAAGRGER